MTNEQKGLLLNFALTLADGVITSAPKVLATYRPGLAAVPKEELQAWLRNWISDVNFAREYHFEALDGDDGEEWAGEHGVTLTLAFAAEAER